MAAAEMTEANWQACIQKAARLFVQTAVVIDNEPWIKRQINDATQSIVQTAPLVTPIDDGTGSDQLLVDELAQQLAGEAQSEVDSNRPEEPGQEAGEHKLDLEALASSFASLGIICGTLFPSENADRATTLSQAKRLADGSDIVIVDWFLRAQDSSPTLDLISSILSEDQASRGRTRLICIYTGEVQLSSIAADLRQTLGSAGISVTPAEKDDIDVVSGTGFRIIILNKGRGTITGIREPALPKRLLSEFSKLVDGLLPSFAAASIAAVRRHANHILSVFSASLDSAYVANRAISDPPDDVAEMIRHLIVSEFDAAIGMQAAADKFLGPDAISAWLTIRGHPVQKLSFKGGDISKDLINWMCQNNFISNNVVSGNQLVKFDESARLKVSMALTPANADHRTTERAFARLVTNKREAFGRGKPIAGGNWSPSLAPGTIIRESSPGKSESALRYFMCITPACDSVRITDTEREMAFLELLREADSKGKFNVIIPTNTNGEETSFLVPDKVNHVRIFTFKVNDKVNRVQACPAKGKYTFTSTNDDILEFEWVAEMRLDRAQRDLQRLIAQWARIGVFEHEWMRLTGKG